MAGTFEEMSIGTKLAVSFAAVLFLTTCLGIISYFTLNGLVNESIPELEIDGKIAVSILQMRRYEKDFLMEDSKSQKFFASGKSQYIDTFEGYYTQAMKNIALLRTIREKKGDKEGAYRVDELKRLLVEYRTKFYAYELKVREKGDAGYGIVAKMAAKRAMLDGNLGAIQDPDANIIYARSELHRAQGIESLYLSKADISLQEPFHSAMDSVMAAIANSAAGKETKDALIFGAKSYAEGFDEVAAIDRQIGLNLYDGMIREYKVPVHSIDPLIEKDMQEVWDSIDRSSRAATYTVLFSALALLGLIIVLDVLILGSITRSLARTAGRVESASHQMFATADGVNTATMSVNRTMQEISRGTEGQSRELLESSRLMHDANTTTKDMAANIENITAEAQGVAQRAQEGGESAQRARQSLGEISSSIGESALSIKELQKVSVEIGDMSDTINELAEQTNMLALNAAIEASRAGDAGKGFTVVSDEVRKLADQSSDATEQIKKLLRQVQATADGAAQTIDRGTKRIDAGRVIVGEALESLQSINSSVKQISAKISTLGTAAQENALKIDKCTANISEVAAIAERTAVGSEEVCASSEHMAQAMKDVVVSAKQLEDEVRALQRLLGTTGRGNGR